MHRLQETSLEKWPSSRGKVVTVVFNQRHYFATKRRLKTYRSFFGCSDDCGILPIVNGQERGTEPHRTHGVASYTEKPTFQK